MQQSITAAEPQTITLAADRDVAQWYGPGGGELVVSSSSAPDGPQGDSVTLEVKLTVDPACQADTDCQKQGHYCAAKGGAGECTPKKPLAQECADPSQCLSGFCAQGVCCQTACDNPCNACNLEESGGQCEPKPEGALCDDGIECTVSDQCAQGECTGTVDCSSHDNACNPGYCDQDSGGCKSDLPKGKCIIDEQCIDEDTQHAEISCLRCLPENDPYDWSPADGFCFINETCFESGDATDEECHICHPSSPNKSTPAADESPCDDDGDVCTLDICVDGTCTHPPSTGNLCDDGDFCTQGDLCEEGECSGTPYECDDKLDCTDQQCDGDGGCSVATMDGTCLIEGVCHLAAATDETGCLQCVPELSQSTWTSVQDDLPCDDANGCTLEDRCEEGLCVGDAKDCDDGLDCTSDICAAETGDCAYSLVDGNCLIGDICYTDGTEKPDSSGCAVCSSETSTSSWSPANEGGQCNDGEECTHTDLCSAGTCAGTSYECDDKLDCTDNLCTGDGECETTLLDGFCLIDDLCQAAGSASAEGCASCDPDQNSTQWTPLSDTTPCDDDDLCTLEDECQQGLCLGVPKNCNDELDCTKDVCVDDSGDCAYTITDDSCLVDGKCHTTGTPMPGSKGCALCDPAASNQTWTAVGDDGPCDDGFFCTVGDTCQDGVCVTQPRSCPDDDCNKGVCDEATAQCAFAAKDDGVLCDDSDVCTVNDICLSGSCEGAAKDCSNFGPDPCVTGICDPDSLPEPGECIPIAKEDGEVCELPGAEALCFNQTCNFVDCLDGHGNCNGKYTDGCETDITKNDAHCGECDNACDYEHAVGMCFGSKCYLKECAEGYSDCDMLPETGCETDTSVDANHCGECGQPCQDGQMFANAKVLCMDSQCHFNGCIEGFSDDDGDCTLGECINGCEECSPLADGTIEIPDDGADNDCVDGDATNSEERGFYVDINFPFGGLCPAPGVGHRDCPFEDIAWALLEAQVNQDWSAPDAVKKEVYVASGTYEEVGTVVDMFRPLTLLGSYQRTLEGPWTRAQDGMGSTIIAGQGAAIITGNTEGWAVIDGFQVTPLIHWGGATVISRISSSEQQPLDIASIKNEGPLYLRSCNVVGSVTPIYNDGSIFRNNTITGDLASSTCEGSQSWTVEDNVIGGSFGTFAKKSGMLQNSTSMTLRRNDVGGDVACIVWTGSYLWAKNYSEWLLEHNTIGGDILVESWNHAQNHGAYSMSQWTLRDNAIFGSISCSAGEAGEQIYAEANWLLERNVVHGNIDHFMQAPVWNSTGNMKSKWVLRGNVLWGNLAFGSKAADASTENKGNLTLINNTLVRDGTDALPALTVRPGTGSAKVWLMNNAFVSLSTEPAHPVVAILEQNTNADVRLLRNNIFVGFDALDHVMMMNEGGNPLNNAAMLNMLSDLSDCSRGENGEVPTLEEALFISSNPDEVHFLEVTAESPLVNAGLDLPYSCDGVDYEAPETDILGNPVPCHGGFDVGAYQYCPVN